MFELFRPGNDPTALYGGTFSLKHNNGQLVGKHEIYSKDGELELETKWHEIRNVKEAVGLTEIREMYPELEIRVTCFQLS